MFDYDDEPVRLVDERGREIHDARYSRFIDDLDDDDLHGLYADLVTVRRIDTEATTLQRQGELGLWAPLLGQEAAQVGSAHALAPDDFVFGSYREHGVAHCRGVGPADLLAMWRGTSLSGWDPYEYNMATPAIVVGSQALHAAGYAIGLQLDHSPAAAIAYFGDGATSQGDIAEALVFAASHGAPVVFFCQNNQWAISEPVSVQSRVPLARRGAGFGMLAVRVDGNDVLAVLAVTRAALDHARDGGGPTFLEAITYRLGPHTTSDDPTRYRTAALVDSWRKADPLLRMRALLIARGLADDDFLDEVDARAEEAAAELRRTCLALPDPPPEALFDHVYAGAHSILDRERRDFAAWQTSLEGEPS